MSNQLTRKAVAGRRRPVLLGNTMGFPRALREAIPDLPTCVGRVLKVEAINGDAVNSTLWGRRVSLKIVVTETGKLTGEFVIRLDLQVDAARGLSETLAKLADRAEKAPAD